MRATNPPSDEGVASPTDIQPLISDPLEWTVGSSSTNQSLSPSQPLSRSCTSLSSAGYEADKEDNGDEEDVQNDDVFSTPTVTTNPATSEEPVEATPTRESLSQGKPGKLPARTEDPVPDRPPSPEADSEVDIEDLLLDFCEPRGFYWNTSEGQNS